MRRPFGPAEAGAFQFHDQRFPGWDAWTPQDRAALHFDADSETACITLNSYPDTQESIRAAMAADTSLSAAEKETVEHLYFSGLSF